MANVRKPDFNLMDRDFVRFPDKRFFSENINHFETLLHVDSHPLYEKVRNKNSLLTICF